MLPGMANSQLENATLAGGCFWCLEHDLESVKGVKSVVSGYSGGQIKNPTYNNHRGHQESVLVEYDESTISYKELLEKYLINVDPFDGEGQFCDRGDSYRAVIFPDEHQADIAEDALNWAANKLNVDRAKIKVMIKKKSKFWNAEQYHQNYAENNPLRYNIYRYACKRDQVLNNVWGKNLDRLNN
tara:strand:- start:8237 stop:8791 length:555 start_codon:yes stop_codon:yes gene_type:complete